MSVTLVPTPGDPTANTYASLDEAEAYFATRPNVAAWTALADDTAKSALLVAGCARLDQERYAGCRASSTQALAWPRLGVWRDGVCLDGTIPAVLKQAQCEEALAIAMNPARFEHDVLTQFDHLKIGPLDLTPRLDNGVTDDLTPMTCRLLQDLLVSVDGTVELVLS